MSAGRIMLRADLLTVALFALAAVFNGLNANWSAVVPCIGAAWGFTQVAVLKSDLNRANRRTR